jgi:PBP1b-binding outer membrane lipoprotein LpoB
MKILTIALCLAIAGLSTVGCSASKKATTDATTATAPMTKSAVGEWLVTVSDTPAGTVEASMVIEQIENAYKGNMGVAGSKVIIDNLKIVDNKITGSFYSSDYGVDVYFSMQYDAANDTLSGYLMDSFKVTGKRKM